MASHAHWHVASPPRASSSPRTPPRPLPCSPTGRCRRPWSSRPTRRPTRRRRWWPRRGSRSTRPGRRRRARSRRPCCRPATHRPSAAADSCPTSGRPSGSPRRVGSPRTASAGATRLRAGGRPARPAGRDGGRNPPVVGPWGATAGRSPEGTGPVCGAGAVPGPDGEARQATGATGSRAGAPRTSLQRRRSARPRSGVRQAGRQPDRRAAPSGAGRSTAGPDAPATPAGRPGRGTWAAGVAAGRPPGAPGPPGPDGVPVTAGAAPRRPPERRGRPRYGAVRWAAGPGGPAAGRAPVDAARAGRAPPGGGAGRAAAPGGGAGRAPGGGAGRAARRMASGDCVGGGGRVSASTVVTDSGVAEPRRAATAMAAPKAMASLGWASMAIGPPQLGAHHLGHERDAGRAADEQDRADLVVRHPGRADGPAQRHDRLGDRRADHRLELGAGEPHLGLQARQQHRDRHVGVARQRLLGVDALLPQAGHGGLGRRAPRGRAGRARRCTAWRTWANTASSKSMPPRRSMPSGVPMISKPSCGAPHHGGVERAAAEVVHGDHRAGLEPCAARRRTWPRPPARPA